MSAERPEDGEDTFGVRETDGVEGLEGWACGGSVPTLPGFSSVCASLQSCPALCDPIDGSPPGSSVPGTLQARTLEWVAISFPNA